MKAYEFPCKVTPEGRVVRMVILLNEPIKREDQEVWARLTAEQFFAGYSEADAVYDEI